SRHVVVRRATPHLALQALVLGRAVAAGHDAFPLAKTQLAIRQAIDGEFGDVVHGGQPGLSRATGAAYCVPCVARRATGSQSIGIQSKPGNGTPSSPEPHCGSLTGSLRRSFSHASCCMRFNVLMKSGDETSR